MLLIRANRANHAARLLQPTFLSTKPSNVFIRQIGSQDKPISGPSDHERDPNKPPSENSAMMRHSGSNEALIDHDNLDYAAHVDHGTSSFSPVPRRVMDGSEATGSVAAAVLSGAPIDLQARTVRIYQPTKSAMQSGTWHQHAWQLDWDVLPKGHRWENPLMGWQSSGDFMQGTRMKFKTKEDAVRFAEKQGYEWYIQDPQERKFTPKAYANNFLHSSKPLKKIPTK